MAQRLPIVDGDDGTWGINLNAFLSQEHYNDGTDNTANGGHKNITIRPGEAGTGKAPLKFTSGVLLTTPEAGALEFVTDTLYLTQTTSTTRKQIPTIDTAGALGDVYYRNAAGAFVRLPVGSTGQVLTVQSGAPAWVAATASFTQQQAMAISSLRI